MTELEVLHEAPVSDDQIDHLGHMNVRYYLWRALDASRELASRTGLSPEACRELGAVLEPAEVFTRHHREQLAGAHLLVRGGVLEVAADGLRMYHELVNPARDEIAATFMHRFTLRDLDDRDPRPIPEMAANAAGRRRVECPEYGRARTLDLTRIPGHPSVEEALERRMAMRAERVVREDECDEQGCYVAARYQELFWGGDPPSADHKGLVGQIEEEKTDRGTPLGWAILENRAVLGKLPRAGTRIQSFGTTVSVAEKVCVRGQWVFDVETGAVLCSASMVDICFDVEARRAIAIPERLREAFVLRMAPEYA